MVWHAARSAEFWLLLDGAHARYSRSHPRDTCDAVLYIDQGDRDDVSVGQNVQIKLEHLADTTYDGKIEKISARESDIAPEPLSNKGGGELATTTDKQGREHLTSSAYQATVRLEGDTDLLRPGMRGRARVTVAHRSAAGWLWRYFRRTFHFRLCAELLA